MQFLNRIQQLRARMKYEQVDAYIIPSSDYHQSEYVGEYFRARQFISGFTGSAGTIVVTPTKAGLWTDGRYFIQAEQELAGTGITLYRQGEENVVDIPTFLENELPCNGTLGFDGRTISFQQGEEYWKKLADKHIAFKYESDFIDSIWSDRPPLSQRPIFPLDISLCGESAEKKLQRVRDYMSTCNADFHLLTSLDDIAWLLNLRGDDIAYSPLFLSYVIISHKEVHLFVDHSRMTTEAMQSLQRLNVTLHPYNAVYEYASSLPDAHSILLDPKKMNYTLYHSLPKNTFKIEETNPTTLWKAIKNETEIKNIRSAHIKDGIAMTRFLFWLKKHLKTHTITEQSAAQKIDELRRAQSGFLSPSFESICAFQEHAAICHYTASQETDCALTEGSFFLADTGGHYFEGSTDITRTFAVGGVTDEMKLHYTTVLQSMIRLAMAHFLYGCTGTNLDILAREPLWSLGLDYNHGTGHGIGYLLNVHEGPCAFRWRTTAHPEPVLEAGMIITDEPGLYLEGQYGIRIENELLVREDVKNMYGQFMNFEVLTLVPIDLDAVDPSLLERSERNWLNQYHQRVYDQLSPYFNDDEQELLAYYTRAI